MPGATLPPNANVSVSGTIGRVERVERVTHAPPPDPQVPMVFSYPGTLTANVESPPWYVPRSGHLLSVRVSLTASAGSNHIVELRVNGAAQQQFTLTSGLKTVATACDISVAVGDYVTVKTITVADSDLAVEVRLR